MAQAVIAFVVLCFFTAYWYVYMRRALRDHETLPYCRYRSTLIFIRVQQRVIIPVLTAVTCSVAALTLAPAFNDDSCWGLIDSQMANLPVYLSLTLAAVVLAFLYMPRAAVDSPLLQELLQDWSWTQAAMPSDIERRCQRLLALEGGGGTAAAASGAGSGGPMRALPFPHHFPLVAQGLAKLTGYKDMREAVEQLRREPIFCMETAIKLFFWSRLAYREDDATTYPWVNAHIALPLFGLTHFETVWDDGTDTHACIGYSDTQVVVAFRGTRTLQNVITDLKTWQAALPGRSRHGRPLRVHAGFLGAWLHSGFNEKVLTRLREIDSGPTPLRFWLTGHSLGGALASLAALDIKREHPQSQITCYVYGCPRVGNLAFASEFNEAVPDTWAIINGLDPIPWVPKWGFKSTGKRVTINPRGDLILRPSFFELSVTHRGSSIKHHSTRGGAGYAVSLAAVLKAQFAASKALPGGAEGVEALAAAVDLGACLVLTNVDLEGLKDPELLPELAEAVAERQLRLKRQGDSQRARAMEGCAASCGCGPMGRRAAPAARQPGDGSNCEECTAGEEGGQPGGGGAPGAAAGSREQRQRWQAEQVLYLPPCSPSAAAAAEAAPPDSTAAAPAAAATRKGMAASVGSVHLRHYPTMMLEQIAASVVRRTGGADGAPSSPDVGEFEQPT